MQTERNMKQRRGKIPSKEEVEDCKDDALLLFLYMINELDLRITSNARLLQDHCKERTKITIDMKECKLFMQHKEKK
jgi:hypothetical protein